MSASDQPIVTRLGTVGVFLSSSWSDEKGMEIVNMVKAVDAIRELEDLAKLTGPKFKQAMEDDATRERVRNALKRFNRSVHYVGVISVKSE